jgi:hypothetical protein
VNDSRAFKVPLYMALASPTITLVLQLFLLPESPWWLLMKGRKDAARKSLLFMNSGNKNFDPEQAILELEYTLQKEHELAEQVSRRFGSYCCLLLQSPDTLALILRLARSLTLTASEAKTSAGPSAPSFPPSPRT